MFTVLKRCLIAIGVALATSHPALSDLTFSVESIPPDSVSADIVVETRNRAGELPDGLPDGVVAQSQADSDILSAWYSDPTTRYGHGILGDAIEAGTLNVQLSDRVSASRETVTVTLPAHEVFEDRYPRIADLDNDGAMEVITIRSSVAAGASVTVYGLVNGQLKMRAQSSFIGLANRWLNIAGIASYLDGAERQIAYVETPHIGGTLYLLTLQGNTLERVASLYGFSNHAIGSREMRLSATVDIDGDGSMELALPSASRQALRIVEFSPEGIAEIAKFELASRIDKAIGLETTPDQRRLLLGLKNGEVKAVVLP